MGDTFGDSGFTDTRLTDQNRVVFGTPRQDPAAPTDLIVTTDHRIEFTFPCLIVQIDRILTQRIILLLAGLAVDRGPLTEFTDRRHELFFRSSRLPQQTSGLTLVGKRPNNRCSTDAYLSPKVLV